MAGEDFEARAATWEQPHRIERARRIGDVMRPLLPAGHPRAVELGAGTGLLSRSLADVLGEAWLLDSSPAMVGEAAKAVAELGWRVEVVDVDGTVLPGAPFDVALSQLAFHHFDDVPAVLSRIHAALNPGGRVIIADLDHDADGAYHAGRPGFNGYHGFKRDEFASWLTEAGFKEVTFRDAGVVVRDVEDGRREFPLFLVAATA